MPLGWMQLWHQKLHFAVALAGVSFAVVLILMQLGFRESMFEGAVRIHRALEYDLVLVSPRTPFIVRPTPFSRRRLYQTLSDPKVVAVAPVYARTGLWKNPLTHGARGIYIMGIDAADGTFKMPEIRDQLEKIRKQDVVLFDALSRPEYGPIPALLETDGRVATELNHRRVHVEGVYRLGTSFGINATVLTNDMNFLRLFPERDRGLIDLGLIRLAEGVDPRAAAVRLRAGLAGDVLLLTEEEFVSREKDYWAATTPIGYVFAFGAIIGLLVGGIIVYQILFADVSDHLPEYATLKAMGYSNAHLSGVVLEQAAILGVLGFIPGLAVCLWLYRIAGEATRLPIVMTPERAFGVLFLTIAMCASSALIALRKVRAADPAEVF